MEYMPGTRDNVYARKVFFISASVSGKICAAVVVYELK
jgi:hypothetical protein